MNKLLQLSLFAAATLVTAQCFAASPKWDYVDLNYVKLDVDHIGIEPDGFDFQGVKLISDNIFVKGSYLRTSDDLGFDEVDYDVMEAGVGYKMSLNSNTDWWTSVSFARLDAETRNTSVEENGFILAAGVRTMLTENFELAGDITYQNFDLHTYQAADPLDNDVAASLQATYYLNDNFGLNFGYRHSSDIDGYSVGVRYAF